MTRRQCKLCPWKVSTDPLKIPGGYDVKKHLALTNTIAEPGKIDFTKELHIMACHESTAGAEIPCVGWLMNQLNEGNNIALRLAVAQRRVDANVKTVGPQHPTLEATFPKRPGSRSREEGIAPASSSLRKAAPRPARSPKAHLDDCKLTRRRRTDNHNTR